MPGIQDQKQTKIRSIGRCPKVHSSDSKPLSTDGALTASYFGMKVMQRAFIVGFLCVGAACSKSEKTPTAATNPTELPTQGAGPASLPQKEDVSPPKAVIRSPAILAISSIGSVTFTLTFEDNFAVESITSSMVTPVYTNNVFCNHTVSGSGTNSDPIIITLSNCSGDGTASVAIPVGVAKDSSGNLSDFAMASGIISVDNTPPNPMIAIPSSETNISSEISSYPLMGTCENGLKVTIEGDVPAGQSVICSGKAFRFSSWKVNPTSLISKRNISVRQTDAAGNAGSSNVVNVIYNPYLPIVPNLAPSIVSGLSPVLMGTCDPNAASHSATSTSGSVRDVICDGNGNLKVLVHLPAGGMPFSIMVTSTNFAGSVSSETAYTRRPFRCPTGYVGVPNSGIQGLGNSSAPRGAL